MINFLKLRLFLISVEVMIPKMNCFQYKLNDIIFLRMLQNAILIMRQPAELYKL